MCCSVLQCVVVGWKEEEKRKREKAMMVLTMKSKRMRSKNLLLISSTLISKLAVLPTIWSKGMNCSMGIKT